MAFKSQEDQRNYNRKWALVNKEKRKILNDRWEIKQKEKFAKFKSSLKCERCSENDPVCLEFHHLDPSKKEVNIGMVSKRWSFKRLEKEMAKCMVLCANCHRKEHARLKSIL